MARPRRYVNGDLVTTGKLPYPEASLMKPLKVTLGGYGGQLGHVCMFNQPLADRQVHYQAASAKFSLTHSLTR